MKKWKINFNNNREPLVIEGETLGKAIEIYLTQNKDLSYANLSYEDLRYIIFRGVNLMGADLSFSDLNYAILNGSNLINTNLKGTNLIGAKLNRTNLKGANLDYSCLPLLCDTLTIKIDKRIACQMLYHALRAMQSVDDEEVRAVLNDDKVLALANQFHRVEECGKIEKEKEKMTTWKPKKGEHYYFIDKCWMLKTYIWKDDDFDNQQYKLGNVFQTYEQAKQALEKITEQFL